MKNRIWLLAAGSLALTLGLALPAQAADHPRVSGQSCSRLAASVGVRNVWSARFDGEKMMLFGGYLEKSDAPCFRTESDCRNWLYWAQSDYPLHNSVQFCHRGLP